MIAREVCEAAFRAAIAACDPTSRVRAALERAPLGGRSIIGIAIGKAALAMARGAGAVARGIAVTDAVDGRAVPTGWRVMVAAHPVPDERSLAAGDAAIELVGSAGADDSVLVLVSGGASALVERPLAGVTLDQIRSEVSAVMASGAPIHEINRARVARSAIKGGKLARMSRAPVVTLVVSDVFDDDPAVIGSGPTVPMRPQDRIELIARMETLWTEVYRDLLRRDAVPVPRGVLTGDVGVVAGELVAELATLADNVIVGYGEPTVAVPRDHGEGGRAQQLALELAKRLRGSDRSAFVAGSDGIDGPAPRARPAPAGAYVDGTTWDAIAARGVDPQRAIEHRDAGSALAAGDALVVTGPTGINHGDIMIVG